MLRRHWTLWTVDPSGSRLGDLSAHSALGDLAPGGIRDLTGKGVTEMRREHLGRRLRDLLRFGRRGRGGRRLRRTPGLDLGRDRAGAYDWPRTRPCLAAWSLTAASSACMAASWALVAPSAWFGTSRRVVKTATAPTKPAAVTATAMDLARVMTLTSRVRRTGVYPAQRGGWVRACRRRRRARKSAEPCSRQTNSHSPEP